MAKEETEATKNFHKGSSETRPPKKIVVGKGEEIKSMLEKEIIRRKKMAKTSSQTEKMQNNRDVISLCSA